MYLTTFVSEKNFSEWTVGAYEGEDPQGETIDFQTPSGEKLQALYNEYSSEEKLALAHATFCMLMLIRRGVVPKLVRL